jgi:catechol 2,3-dioxygenase-like lactoylglutathione lyase family enzyme
MGDVFDQFFVAPSNFDRALAFYRDTLGRRADWAWGGNDAPRRAQLNGAGVRIVFANERSLPGNG